MCYSALKLRKYYGNLAWKQALAFCMQLLSSEREEKLGGEPGLVDPDHVLDINDVSWTPFPITG